MKRFRINLLHTLGWFVLGCMVLFLVLLFALRGDYGLVPPGDEPFAALYAIVVGVMCWCQLTALAVLLEQTSPNVRRGTGADRAIVERAPSSTPYGAQQGQANFDVKVQDPTSGVMTMEGAPGAHHASRADPID